MKILERKEIIKKAVELGRNVKSANKSNTMALQKWVENQTPERIARKQERQRLIDIASTQGMASPKRASLERLQTFTVRHDNIAMPKTKNVKLKKLSYNIGNDIQNYSEPSQPKNPRYYSKYGLSTKELKQITSRIGMDNKGATKEQMENFITDYATHGDASKAIKLSKDDKESIKMYAKRFLNVDGLDFKAIKYMTYKISSENEYNTSKDSNFARLSFAEAISHNYSGAVTTQMIDEVERIFEQNGLTWYDAENTKNGDLGIMLLQDYIDKLNGADEQQGGTIDKGFLR